MNLRGKPTVLSLTQVMTLKRELAFRGAGDHSAAGPATTGASKGEEKILPNPLNAALGSTMTSPGDMRPLVAVLQRIELSLNEGLALQRARMGAAGGAAPSA